MGAHAVGPLGLARGHRVRRVRGAPLARFNVQVGTVEKRHFLGLPSPAAADVVATTVLLFYYMGGKDTPSKHLSCHS